MRGQTLSNSFKVVLDTFVWFSRPVECEPGSTTVNLRLTGLEDMLAVSDDLVRENDR
jgi:hypothetical protein